MNGCLNIPGWLIAEQLNAPSQDNQLFFIIHVIELRGSHIPEIEV
jgi:hypothetical protein